MYLKVQSEKLHEEFTHSYNDGIVSQKDTFYHAGDKI